MHIDKIGVDLKWILQSRRKVGMNAGCGTDTCIR